MTRSDTADDYSSLIDRFLLSYFFFCFVYRTSYIIDFIGLRVREINRIIQWANRDSFPVNRVDPAYMPGTKAAMGSMRLRKTGELRRAHESHVNSADLQAWRSGGVRFPLRTLQEKIPSKWGTFAGFFNE